MTQTLDTRRIVLADESIGHAELAVHALAQLGSDVHLELHLAEHGRRRLELIATAYGVAGQISFVSAHDDTREPIVMQATTLAEFVESLCQFGGVPVPPEADSTLQGQRIAIVTNLPTHYRVPLFNMLGRRATEAGAALRVLFLAQPPSTRAWMIPGDLEFEHEFLCGIDVSRDRGRRIVPLSLIRRLADFSPTLILAGGFSPAVSGRLSLYARRKNIAFGVWSGEIASRPTARHRGRAMQRRWLTRRATFAIAYGSQSADYLRSLRPDLPVVLGRNTTLIPAPRSRAASSGPIEVLAVARAEAKKALDVVVEAVRRTPRLPCRLTVIGDGPQLSSLVGRAQGDERIRFLGALPPREVRKAFMNADVFVFPSRYDVFGLVLVEAMGAGLATLVSPLPGAVADLCVSEHNCIIVEDGTPGAWASALTRVVEGDDLRRALGAAAERTIHRRWTIAHAADAMLAGFRLGALAQKEH